MEISTLTPLADHLWQSTLVVAVVGLLTLALRRNHARVRYAVWMAASIKFLVPFAVLIAVGQAIPWPQPAAIQGSLSTIVGTVGQPFSAPRASSSADAAAGPSVRPLVDRAVPALLVLWAIGSTTLLVVWIRRWRRIAASVRHATPLTSGRVVDGLARLHPNVIEMRVVVCDTHMEPGVFGLHRPVLVWPRGIDDRLTDAQIDAILLHEIAHVRRRDNLAAALHMAVQTIFWFHPLTWWIGSRLVDERERACDEDVVHAGSEPHVYAEGILKTCQYFVESPLACVSGVTGSDLKTRIEQIMKPHAHGALHWSKRILLGVALVAAIAGPVAIGILTSARVQAQVVVPGANAPTFEVASVKPNDGSGGRMGGRGAPGRLDLTGMSLRRLIRQAYRIHDSQIIGGPDWIGAQGFDISATAPGAPPDQMRVMLQTLLRDRFKLTFHAERRDLPVYALIVARSDGRLGEGLKRTPEGACLPRGAALAGNPPSTAAPPTPPPSPSDPDAKAAGGWIIFGPGRLLAHGVPIDMFADALGGLPAITAFNRIVQNQTGLEGTYDFDFKFANELAGRGGPFAPAPPPAATPGDEPAMFTALQEQLGLKLDARRANVEVLVIDSVQKPDAN